MKKLYRSTKNKKLSGVCGGLARYFGIDATIVRILWVAMLLIPGIGLFISLIVYIICSFVIPKEPDYIDVEVKDIEE